MGWSNGLAEWCENTTAYLSVAFSWRVPDAFQRAIWYQQLGYQVRAGGPGLFTPTARKMLSGVAAVGGHLADAVIHHNPLATFASRGCPVGCSFCIVPIMEGITFTLLPDFTPRPVLCDSNLSALPVVYQKYIIAKYEAAGVPLLDANGGFEPRTFDAACYHRWQRINKGPWRFAYDETREEPEVHQVTTLLREVPSAKKRVYILIGNEPFDACYRRIIQVIEWGCEPHVQPMIALNAMTRAPLVRFDWTIQRLSDLARWANRWVWRTVPFTEYRRSVVAIRERLAADAPLLGMAPAEPMVPKAARKAE